MSVQHYPRAVYSGVVYDEPVRAPNGGCRVCEHLELCREVVADGGLALCEIVLDFEELPSDVEAIVMDNALFERAL